MKKTIIAAALAIAATGAMATGNYYSPGISGSTSGTSGQANSTSVAGAVSTGNGYAATRTSGSQESSARSSDHAYTYWTGHGSNKVGNGDAGVSGSTLAKGQAKSETISVGQAAAGSATFGSSDAKSGGVAGFNTFTGANGGAAGGSKSHNDNIAATGAIGNGYAIAGNKSGNAGSYSAHVDAGSSKYGNATNYVITNAEADNKSWSRDGDFAIGNAGAYQNNSNFGGAVSGATGKAD